MNVAPFQEQEVEWIIHHVVLPPRLPQSAEEAEVTACAKKALLGSVASLSQLYLQQAPTRFKASWRARQRMLSTWAHLQPSAPMSKRLFTKSVTGLRAGGSIPIRIRAQNAGLIFRHIDEAVSIECFELSPRSENVTTCTGRLRRRFPAHAVAIPLETFIDARFLEELFSMLDLMDSEVVDEMMPQSVKAGSRSAGIRDTCHPGLVTELLMTMLHAVARPVQVVQIEKRTLDDVLWKDSLLPWRRSPFWLMLRVSIQTTLLQDLEGTDAVAPYKDFMVFFLTDPFSKTSEHTTKDYPCKVLQLKIARRSAKLGVRISPSVHSLALSAAEDMDEKHNEIWRNIQAEDAERGTTIDLATISEDTVLTLSNRRAALDSALSKKERGPQQTTAVDFIRDEWVTYDTSNLPRIISGPLSADDFFCSR